MMGSLEAGHRHRDHLPALGFLGKDGSGYPPKHPAVASAPVTSPGALLSPTSMYAGQPLPCSYPTSSASVPSVQPGYISPTGSRRALEEEKEKQQSQPQRQSLPSIHEALGNDNPLPYPAPTSAAPQQPHHAPHSHLLSNVIGRPTGEAPSGPPNPFSNVVSSGPYVVRDSAYPQSQLQAEASRASLASVTTQDSRNHSIQSLSSGKSPTQSQKTGITSIAGSQTGSAYEYSAPTSAGSIASPNGYGTFPQNFSFQSQPPPNAPTYPVAYDARPYGTTWKSGVPETARVEEMRGGLAGRAIAGQIPGDSVKRHLDVYDVETSLNEIAEMSTRTLDFSRHYAARAHQTQRSGPIIGSLPSLQEVEEMLSVQRRNQDALLRIRAAVVSQEHALAEQMAQRKAFKASGVREDDHMAMYQDEYKGSGGFAGPDSKKRRGKAAPPGRCHSCNRAETPEWRRGPDGARTLCNACGLHYAKLTRKMGAKQASSLGSNLKPKTADSASPTGR